MTDGKPFKRYTDDNPPLGADHYLLDFVRTFPPQKGSQELDKLSAVFLMSSVSKQGSETTLLVVSGTSSLILRTGGIEVIAQR